MPPRSAARSADFATMEQIASAGSSHLDEALRFIAAHDEPLVVKASGLAAGKGAIVCASRDEAMRAAREMFGRGEFGDPFYSEVEYYHPGIGAR